MCGIIGFSSKRKSNTDKLALLMLHNSLERGQDNTGIYSIETGVIKSEKKAVDFLSEIQLPRTSLFIGHVRKASVGSKQEKNAHPVEGDNLVLVHNGTLTNHYAMCREAGYDNKDFDTDTQIVTKLLDDDSKKEKIVYSTLSEFTGAATFLFTDKRDPTLLYAYRNGDRPLFYGFTDGGMYISSLKESLLIINCTKIEEFPALFLHSIRNGVLINSIFYREKEKPTYTNNYTNNFHSNVTNVKWKNPLIGESLDVIKKISDVTTDRLVDHWLKATVGTGVRFEYGPNNFVEITKDRWYFVEDSHPSNNFDIQVTGNDGNQVWVNKFLFDCADMNYPTGYGCAITNIFEEGDPLNVIFTKGTIISLVSKAIIDKDCKIACIYDTDKIIAIPVNTLRPALKEEVAPILDERAEQLNKLLQITSQQAINFNKLLSIGNSNEPSPFIESIEEVSEEDISIVGETEVLPAEFLDETEEVVHAILDVLDEKVDDLFELSESTNWPELKEGVQELKDLIYESYNVDMVRDNIKKD